MSPFFWVSIHYNGLILYLIVVFLNLKFGLWAEEMAQRGKCLLHIHEDSRVAGGKARHPSVTSDLHTMCRFNP